MSIRVLIPLLLWALLLVLSVVFSKNACEDQSKFVEMLKPNGWYALRNEINEWNDPAWDKESFFMTNPNHLGCIMGYSLK